MSSPITAGMASIWLQYGQNQQPLYLGCHSIEEISQGLGDKTLIWCKDPSGPNKFVVASSVRGAADPVAFTVETLVKDVADYMEAIDGKVTFLINYSVLGRQDLFVNYDRTSIMIGSEMTNKGESAVAARTPEDNAEHLLALEFGADTWKTTYKLSIDKQNTTETEHINGIVLNPIDVTEAYAVADADTGANAAVLHTTDGGGVWAATAADPFAVDEHIKSVTMFPVSRTVNRVLVVRGASAPVGDPLEVAYSDDEGATWTVVTVGAVVNQAAVAGGALFSLDMFHIWLVATGGYVYFSNDGGVTWSAQDAGIATVSALRAVHFADGNNGIAVGAADAILITHDGGNTWNLATATGSADPLTACAILDHDRAWVGVDAAGGSSTLYYTEDAGLTWSARNNMTDPTVGQINCIRFTADGQIGFAVKDTAAPVGAVLRSRDGGYSWESFTTPTNAGLNFLAVIDENTILGCGNVSGGVGVLIKASRAIGA